MGFWLYFIRWYGLAHFSQGSFFSKFYMFFFGALHLRTKNCQSIVLICAIAFLPNVHNCCTVPLAALFPVPLFSSSLLAINKNQKSACGYY